MEDLEKTGKGPENIDSSRDPVFFSVCAFKWDRERENVLPASLA